MQPRAARVDPLQIVRLYVIVLGAGLLLEGAALLVLDTLKIDVGIATNDWRHNLLHIVWGIALLAVSAVSRGPDAIRVAWAALIFGTFYIALGVLGLTVDRPFGLLLGPGETPSTSRLDRWRCCWAPGRCAPAVLCGLALRWRFQLGQQRLYVGAGPVGAQAGVAARYCATALTVG